ncbi:tyrosyl-DNA phosphodiesterase 2 isoform X3 [Lagenorhynchus albirostris]|uniref:tyrosyl-DNA phosphodiesterase 2 isoform X3 n=1 Tax=Lagenorhynchus albirostris TaxID=27610 RepID=UPI0028E9F031|nr:tyrosyl-DNA phosphodiesterase 2 isoform X3 [Lagenorhynchus albirostris]
MEQKSGPDGAPEGEREEGEPEVKKRRLLCVEFASVASCDAAVAQCYLAENDWEMERALDSYFEPAVEENALKSHLETASEPEPWMETRPSSGADASLPKSRLSLRSVDLTKEETSDSTSSKTSTSENVQQEDGSMFSFITWNIDGLDLNNLPERARGVCSYLTLYSPDVVFLQEVIPPYAAYLKKKASSYEIITGREEGYFTAIMLKKSRLKFKSQEIIPFPNTKMMRNLLCVHVSKCGGLPSNTLDVWEFLGKPKHCQYTWDTQMNSNLGIAATCKLRFDRIFFRAAAEGGHIIPRSLDLLGLEKLDCGRFPSDHWGLLCTLDLIL